MKALTLWQPWASLTTLINPATGLPFKWIETRSWSTKYRGPLAIHAAARRPAVGVSNTVRGWGIGYHRLSYADHVDEGYSLQRLGGFPVPMPLGAVVATCRLVNVVPMVDVLSGEGAGDHYASQVALYLLPDGVLELVDRFADMDDETRTQIVSDQFPYGDFAPDRYAWVFEDIAATTVRCPGCWGKGWHDIRGYGPGSTSEPVGCKLCGHNEERTCEPVPARGRQQLWDWAA